MYCCFQFGLLNDPLFGKELFIRFTVDVFHGRLSVCVYFAFGFEGGMRGLII